MLEIWPEIKLNNDVLVERGRRIVDARVYVAERNALIFAVTIELNLFGEKVKKLVIEV